MQEENTIFLEPYKSVNNLLLVHVTMSLFVFSVKFITYFVLYYGSYEVSFIGVIALFWLQGFPEILQGILINPYTRRYTPPLDEFEVDHCTLHHGESVVFRAIPGPSIFLVTMGSGTMQSAAEDAVSEGDVLFVPAGTEVSVAAASEFHMYRSGVNSRIF